MQLKTITLILTSALSNAAVITQRQDTSTSATAALKPYLAPACQLADPVTQTICYFPDIALSAGNCVNVNSKCSIHPPTSFTASLTAPSSNCKIAVWNQEGCAGDRVDGVTLGTGQSNCVEAPFFGNAVNGGLLSGSLLPFGFKSAMLVCGS